jgi:hypothetical protein
VLMRTGRENKTCVQGMDRDAEVWVQVPSACEPRICGYRRREGVGSGRQGHHSVHAEDLLTLSRELVESRTGKDPEQTTWEPQDMRGCETGVREGERGRTDRQTEFGS